MAAITGRQRRGSDGRRKAQKKKHSSSKTRSEKCLRTHRTIYLHWREPFRALSVIIFCVNIATKLFQRCLMFFLLFDLSGASSLPVEGQKGRNITLTCNLSNSDLSTALTFGSKIVYGGRQDEHFRGRVHKTGTCNYIIQHLKTTDAGTYTLHVNDKLDQFMHNVHVYVPLTAREGEEVMFDDLPRDAESVKHLTNRGSLDVWRREQGVLTDRLDDKDGHLIIKNFTSSDAGTYRVLNSTGGVLVTVTLTECGTESKDKQDSTHDDKTKGTERDHVFICVGVLLALVALIAFVFMIHRHLIRNKDSQCKTLYRSPDHQTTAVATW